MLNLKLTSTQLNKLASFQEQATKIIFKDTSKDFELPSIINLRRKHACEFVKRTLEGDVPDVLKENFVLKDHGRNTRNNGCSVALPIIKTEYARHGFYFMGAKIFNELPLDIRRATDFKEFEKLLKFYFDFSNFILIYFNLILILLLSC